MSYLKTDGIVIREVNTGDADKIIVVFSRENGKISCAAKGSRRPTSRLVGSTQFLCYSDFTLFKGKSMYSINGSSVIDCFYNIRTDIEKLTYASYAADVIYDVVQENQPFIDALNLFLNTLHMISNTNRSVNLIISTFELKLMCIAGYSPHILGCIWCGNQKEESLQNFNFAKSGFVCKNCKTKQSETSVEISLGATKAIKYIVGASRKKLFDFELSQSVREELIYISHRYLEEMLEKRYTKLNFLNKIY